MNVYHHVLQPLSLKHTTLRNRFMMGSMHTGLEEDADYGRLAAFYEARAKGGVGLIVTGGYAPTWRGWLAPFSATLSSSRALTKHQQVTDVVHAHGAKIAVQLLHAGRYAYHPFAQSASRTKSPISPFTASKLSNRGIQKTIQGFVKSAQLAKSAGYDGVEIMGSEGYLINQFIAERTNHRDDSWGGSYANRIRFPLEIVKAVREAVGAEFLIIYRLSMWDGVPKGSIWSEVVELAHHLEATGVDLLNTGIGWHEARIPTIATAVPRAFFSELTQKIKQVVRLPVITSNRINDPAVAEQLIAEGYADMVSMARPFLADPDFVNKTKAQAAHRINTCIACNQACLDHVFQKKLASCLVNPVACHETTLKIQPRKGAQRIAVVGAGPAGLSFAVTAAERGYQVTLFERSESIGGQFNYAKQIPGKAEFHETIRYYQQALLANKLSVVLNQEVTAEQLLREGYDRIVIATGVLPRTLTIPGSDRPNVLSYLDVLRDHKPVGKRVAIIGAGGIGFDVATFLCHHVPADWPAQKAQFQAEWGIDLSVTHRGGLCEPVVPQSEREIYLCQRKSEKMGANLGKTTGWIHRAVLKKHGVKMLTGVAYSHIDAAGLHIKQVEKISCLAVDTIVICAGQLPSRALFDQLKEKHPCVDLIGGAFEAKELDAKAAILQGTKLALEC